MILHRFILFVLFLLSIASPMYAYTHSSASKNYILLSEETKQILSNLYSETKRYKQIQLIGLEKKWHIWKQHQNTIKSKKTLANILSHASILNDIKKRNARLPKHLLAHKKIQNRKQKKHRKTQTKTLCAKVNLKRQHVRIYKNNTLLYTWKISSGKNGYRTPIGSYKPLWLSKNYHSKKYNNASMPYAVFFANGYAFHGTTSLKRLGKRVSHGCIRLHPSNAREFYRLVRRYGRKNTEIVIQ